MIEMSFNFSNYQHQLKNPNLSSSDAYDPVFPTIFLDKNWRHLWTTDNIDESKIIKQNLSSCSRYDVSPREEPHLVCRIMDACGTSLSESCWWWLKLRMAFRICISLLA